jgi:two-component system, cell cycle sensor histidine kinase and response regulator CckA
VNDWANALIQLRDSFYSVICACSVNVENNKSCSANGSTNNACTTAHRLSFEVATQIVRHMLDPVLVADVATHQFVCANDAAQKMLGISHDEITRLKVSDIHPADKWTYIKNAFKDQACGNCSLIRNIPVLAAGGKIITFDIQAIPVTNDNKPCLLGIFSDVSDRQSAQQQIAQSEGRLRLAIEALPMGLHLYTLEDDGSLVFQAANPAADRILGVPNSQFIGKRIEAAFPPLINTDVPSAYRRVAKEGGIWRQEQVQYKDNHIEGAYEVVAFQVKPGQMAAMFWDICERKKSEIIMKRLTAAVDSVGESVIITDPAGLIQYVNPYFEKMTGYSAAEVLNKKIGSLKSGRQDKEYYRKLWDVIRNGGTWAGVLINKKKDGTLFEEEATISPVFDQSGNIIHYVAARRDMTRVRDLERRIIRSQKMAALGQLAHRVAHETANSLAIIMGNAGLIQQATDDLNILSMSKCILKATEDIAALSTNLLAFSHPASTELKALPLDKLIHGLSSILASSSGQGIKINLDLAPDCRVPVDAAQFEQALIHLVINAVESIDQRGSINIRLTKGLKPESYEVGADSSDLMQTPAAILEVEDTGCGMDPEDCERAFEPFFSTKKDKRRNAGLGLATVYNIIARHNGEISARSQPGRGTTMTICLPLAADKAPAQPAG